MTVRPMTTTARTLARWRRATALRRVSGRVSEFMRKIPVVVALTLVLASGLLAALLASWPLLMPWTIFVPVIVLAGLFLPPRWLALVLLFVAGLLAYDGWYLTGHKYSFTGNLVVTLLVAATMTWLAVSRARLGVQGTLGESMLVDLRDRLRAHGSLPMLPEPWHAEAAVHPAYGQSFSGDFVVASSSSSADRVEVALADVSGKGFSAGTRALLLSGAFGGLLGAMEPADFLGAANSYLIGQSWREGFATAIHVALDLDTGRFSVGRAGHPPAVKFSAGSGLWQVLDAASGPLLGVVGGASFPRTRGWLRQGDALLLYTDGVIESRTRDLDVGTDRMLGTAERLVSDGFTGGASRICAAALAGETDDRTVVLIWRS